MSKTPRYRKEELEYVEECGSAIELVKRLRPEHPEWDGLRQIWGFRGQAEFEWNLKPTAFRSGFFKKILPKLSQEPDALTRQQLNELSAFYRFSKLADSVGFYVPGSERLFSAAENKLIRLQATGDKWPPDSILEGLAIAQHHGVPTRLIDFTRNPLVAAFFAASDALKKKTDKEYSGYFSVWAVNLTFLANAWARSNMEFEEGISTVEVPSARNPFLKAQDAFFLLDRDAGNLFRQEEGRGFRPLDESILTRAGDPRSWEIIGRKEAFCRPPIVRKFKIPVTEAQELLEDLYAEKISRVHLMPTLDNVTQTLQARRDIEMGFI